MKTNREKWETYHSKNPAIYELFKKFTFEAIRAGNSKLSAWLIINRIRWETDVVAIKTDGCKFKISNNHIGYYSRLFMEEYPEHDGFFVTKRMKS